MVISVFFAILFNQLIVFFFSKGPEFENSLFDLYGRSPLVDCFMHKQKARKLNSFETLITHPSITALPPLNAQSKTNFATQIHIYNFL